MFRTVLISSILFCCIEFANAKEEKVTFFTEDSLKVTADLYMEDLKNPFILLFHQAGSSRGEYNDIAARLLKLDFNCLSIDLRSGGKMNYIANETAQRAREDNIPNSYLHEQKDLQPAIEYVKKLTAQSLILIGGSYSASLSLIEAARNESVKAVVAFNPGEFFLPKMSVNEQISELEKPIFVTATDKEEKYVKKLLEEIPEQFITYYTTEDDKNLYGAKILWSENNVSNQCWLELMMFINKVRNEYR